MDLMDVPTKFSHKSAAMTRSTGTPLVWMKLPDAQDFRAVLRESVMNPLFVDNRALSDRDISALGAVIRQAESIYVNKQAYQSTGYRLVDGANGVVHQWIDEGWTKFF